jgi:hypothetical protein
MPRPCLVGLILALAVSGCAAQKAGPKSPERSALEHDPKAFVAKVAELRGLPERRPTPIVFHSESSFAQAMQKKAELDNIGPTPADSIPFQIAFGLVIPTESGGRPPTSLGAVQRGEVVAFYDQFSHSVHVRRETGDDQELPFVIAHEIGHALQAQHFRVPDVASVTDEDTRLARLALIEGDAMLAMLAFGADRNHVPLTRALVRLARGSEEATIKSYNDRVNSSALTDAPPFIRDRLSFPYLSGAHFVGSIFRAGGYALVNRLYDVPPASTEQILHPEKYLAGELAVPVRAPEPPRGHEPVVSGHVGELLVRSMLALCNTKSTTEAAAAGWGGDAFTITQSGDQAALLFSTIWDDVGEAQEFENAMRRTAACWDRIPGPLKQIFPGGTTVARSRDRVSVVRGLAPPVAKAALRKLAELPGTRIAALPPFGPISIPPPRVPVKVHPPYAANGRITSQYLGLSIPLPPDFQPELGDEILLSREGPSTATMLLGISDWVFSQETIELSFQQFAKGLHNKLAPDQRLVVVGDTRVQTPVGQAIQRVWQVEGTSFRGRLLLVPICRNTGALVIAQGYSDESAERSLHRVLSGIRPLRTPSPLCAELDP